MLHRQSLESQVWANPTLWHLWCYCLLRANHKPAWVTINTGRGITEVHVKAGQFVFGRFKAAEALGVKPGTIYSRLQRLKKMGNINTDSRTHYSIVTIVNWDTYQSGKNAIQHPTNRQPTGNQQPTNTNKNDKNGNNDNKYSQNSEEFRLSKLLLDLILERKPDFKRPDLQRWSVHVNRMICLDGRDSGRVEAVIRWCQQEDFWQNNILSTEKLRKHFDKLELQMKGKKNGRKKTDRDFTQTSEIGTTIKM